MNQSRINPARLAEVAVTPLGKGGHVGPEDGMCVMEAAAYVAGEPWSEAPQCVCPVIRKLMVSWNDALPSDAERNRLLKPLVPMIINTRSTAEVENKRRYLAVDWLLRVHTPAWLALRPELLAHAASLRGLAEITDLTGATTACAVIRAARDAAYEARAAAGEARAAAYEAQAAAGEAGEARAEAWEAGAAAGEAGAEAWDAAGGYAARDAAGTALWSATGGYAAWDAAWAAAGGYAARDAAWAAAWDAAWASLAPTTAQLQISAVDLVARMCAVNEF